MERRTLLVTGASGHLGRRVAELLLGGPDQLVLATRHPEKLTAFAAAGAAVRSADFDRPQTLEAAFAGVDRMLLISTDALDRPGRRLKQHLAAADAAIRAGVRHIVYTSLTHPEPDSPILIAPDHWGTEMALAASRVEYTVLRNNLYTDYLPTSLVAAVASGQLISAGQNGGIGYVTHEDCARAAAAALRSTETRRATYDVTGPAVVARAELAALAAELTGRPVEYVPVAPDVLRAGMIAAGLPPQLADLLVSFQVAEALGHLAVAGPAVLQLTGQAPTSVAAYFAGRRELLNG
ncbi:MAG TPA: NAD(P)H-binding protein [Haliangiales bacterium]|nr:NAD(P)H-binding protein [Haliangiales bacterium]